MSLEKIKDKTLATVGTISFTIAVYLLAPRAIAIPAALLVLIVAGAIVFLQSRWVESEADEWLLVIRDGKMIKAGIGMKTLIGFSDTVVKFPSRVEKVTFSANNVTQ